MWAMLIGTHIKPLFLKLLWVFLKEMYVDGYFIYATCSVK
jgi:hypothetical protein